LFRRQIDSSAANATSKIAMQTTLKWRRVWLVWRTSAHRRARWANAGKTITLESYIVELAYGP
jgi:hypothetical protein